MAIATKKKRVVKETEKQILQNKDVKNLITGKMKLEKVNTGKNNDGRGDTYVIAFEKVNRNFKSIENELGIKLKHITCNKHSDGAEAFKDINENFYKIENHINN